MHKINVNNKEVMNSIYIVDSSDIWNAWYFKSLKYMSRHDLINCKDQKHDKGKICIEAKHLGPNTNSNIRGYYPTFHEHSYLSPRIRIKICIWNEYVSGIRYLIIFTSFYSLQIDPQVNTSNSRKCIQNGNLFDAWILASFFPTKLSMNGAYYN